MPGKTQRRRKAEMLRRKKRNRSIVAAASALAVVVIVGAAMVLMRQLRLGEVHVDPAPLAAPSTATPSVGLHQIVVDSIQAMEELPRNRHTPAPQLGSAGANTDTDVAIAPVGWAPALAGGDRPPGSDQGWRSTAIAQDPYVFAVDTRRLQWDSDLSISAFEEAIAGLDPGPVPLAVAGDEPMDFAALLTYLSGEFLSEAQFASLVTVITQDDGAAGTVEAELERVRPALNRLREWKSRGLLIANWTDWDREALLNAISNDGAATYFLKRSALKEIAWEDRFNLTVIRLPTAQGRRTFRQIGLAVAAVPVDGPRSDAAPWVAELLRGQEIQNQIESRTAWSPVALNGSPINREHRDVVRWFNGADRYIAIDPALAEHEVFRRAHAALRQ